ncbi:cell division protein FtsY [Stenotrophomonas humi]|uniref:Signal recognition particle receptor FtsY n=1 Tax=Stenotrophomonas humi TaxID=405444 RepID=A0A0R0CLE2_9GAMM|nr:signal recognition particle-docking protein FtsY [Stenotrophomonas humi]KRG65955.1 cell division protein FtsY [Stenotrophomonas humi]
MFSFFRRKKTDDAVQPAKPSTLSAEDLAAAFPKAPAEATPQVDISEAFAPPVVEAPVAEPVVIEVAPVAAPAVLEEALPTTVIAEAVIEAPVALQAAVEIIEAAPAPQAEAQPEVAAPVPAPAVAEVIPAPPAQSDDALIPANAAPAAASGKLGWRERLRNSTFARSFGGLFSRNPKLDDDLLDEIETALITADVGVPATTALIEDLRKRMKSREFADANALLAALRADLIALLQPVSKPLVIDTNAKPFVILTVGVNGVGKTTTIGKLAKRFKDDGHSLMLAAGDTFRAAAVAQLQIWGERNGVAVVAQGQNADAASVAFDALQAGKARGTSVLIADTAGRLHTQTGLMNELSKIRRVLGKIDDTAPHEVLMVIDGTTGQNALSQLRQFHAAAGVTGLVVTKLDGTAKGGVVFALAREFGIPIRFAGIGERPEDLRMFDPEAFVDALLPQALGSQGT